MLFTKIYKITHPGGWFTVEGGGNNIVGPLRGHVGDAGEQVMMGYGGAGAAGNGGDGTGMAPSTVGGGGGGPASNSIDVLGGSTGDYSPQGTPNSLVGHATGSVDATGPYGPQPGSAHTTYSPQDSPASSAGGNHAAVAANGHLPTFGFTQEQVACVCEVSFSTPPAALFSLVTFVLHCNHFCTRLHFALRVVFN